MEPVKVEVASTQAEHVADAAVADESLGPVGEDAQSVQLAAAVRDDLPVDDAEAIARMLNERKRGLLEPGFIDSERLTSSAGEEYLPPEKDFYTERPEEDSGASTAREVVSLPVIIRVFYDWARGRGWHQGDGGLSAFVTDCLLDHFNNCWGRAVVVVRRDEVEVGDDGRSSEPGLLRAGNGRKSAP